MKVLVIGGMGVIGGAVTEASVRKGFEVTVLSRSAPSGKWKDLNAKYIQGNWWDDDIASKTVSSGFDVIVDTLIFEPKHMDRSAAIANGHCRQFIYISTDSVYSRPNTDLKEDEEINIKDIKWDYGINKRKAELFLISHSSEYSFDWTVIRPTITFGDTRIPVGFSSRRGTYTLIERMEKGKPILRFDDGKTRHAVCHTSTFGNAVSSLFLNKKAYGNFYHVSDDKSYTFDEIFHVIESITGTKGIYVHSDAKVLKKYNTDAYMDMICDKDPEFTLDNSKIRQICPDVSFHADLKDVLGKTISYLKEHRNDNGEDKDYDLLTDLILLKSTDAGSSEYIKSLSDERIREISRYASDARKENTVRGMKKRLRRIKHSLFR